MKVKTSEMEPPHLYIAYIKDYHNILKKLLLLNFY